MSSVIIIITICFLCSTFLFWKAAGTLNPGKLNTISYIYYIYMIQSFIGTALIMMGFDKHYTLSYLVDREKSIRTVSVIVLGISVALPLLIILFQKYTRINMRRDYERFLKKKIEYNHDLSAFIVVLAAVLICSVILIGFICKIGYVPFFKFFFASDNFEFSVERARIGKLWFINPYFTNIFVLSLIPLFSYISFSYMLAVKDKKWFFISLVLFIMSVIVKTIKFEKSPLIFHILVYILIYTYYKGKIKKSYIMALGFGLAGLLVFFYAATGFSGSILDIYNGPLGRTLFTEVGTLAYSFDMFPAIFPFLGGRSFSPTILRLLGVSGELHLRSAKLTMAYYGSERVYEGSAGVMNTLFAGEAYANFGYKGVVFSVIWVAVFIGVTVWIILRLKKTPVVTTFAALMTMKLGAMLEGGFFDFMYNFDLILIAIVIFGSYLLFDTDGKIQRLIHKNVEKMSGMICLKFKMLKKS